MSRASAARTEKIDGRLLRTERSRELVAAALYELVGEGELEPSAQQVADRAEVNIRTVFRLFSDMDALYATLNSRLVAEVTPIVSEKPHEGTSVRERASALVAERASLYERIAPYLRATNFARARSSFLASQYRKVIAQLRERLVRWLPELAGASPDLLEALDLATSFEAWDRLRRDQRLSRARARSAMERTALALANELEEES